MAYQTLLTNKKAHHDYEISKTLMAGIVLTGQEVKSLRLKHGSLKGSHVKIIGGEAFLLNAQINPYSYADTREYDPKRTRKLLLQKKEIFQLSEASNQQGWAIVPVKCVIQNGKIKVEVGLGRGKKSYDKRAQLKKRTQKREIEKQLKHRVRG